MVEYRTSSHTTSSSSDHIVWVTKYRYQVLRGDIQLRCRDILIQVCNSENVHILKGVVGKDHIHLHIEYAPSLSVKQLKGRSSHYLQDEFPALCKQYSGSHFWAVGYGV